MSLHFDLSILIVNWNGREMLRALLESIGRHSGELNVQTIVVDNASTDGSADMVTEHFPSLTITLIRNTENLGFAKGNNQAAAVATAPLLLLLNNDTVVRDWSLQTLVKYMDENPETVAVGPKLLGRDGAPQWTGRNLPTVLAMLNSIQFLKWTGLFRSAYKKYRRGNFDPNVSGSVGQLAAAALMIRSSAFHDIGGFDEQFPFGVEDVDLCARLAKFGSIDYLSDTAIDHLGRISSRANRGFVYRGYECGWARYLLKHHSQRASLWYKVLVTIDMPFRLMVLGGKWIGEKLTDEAEDAAKTRDMLVAAWDFMFTGMKQFWKT